MIENIDFTKHLELAIDNSNKKISQLNKYLLSIHDKCGCMSSHKVRHLLNNVCNFDGCNYLEIGTHEGSTFCSAIYNNNLTATSIDWWRKWGKPGQESRNRFFENLSKFIKKETKETYKNIRIIDDDCFQFNFRQLKNVNVFFYDGDHSEDSQYKAFSYYHPILNDKFIFIIDDWNDSEVKLGTSLVFKDLKYKVEKFWELPGQFGNWTADSDFYWNGIFVGIINK